MTNFKLATLSFALSMLCVVIPIPSSAQTFASYNLNGATYSSLVQGFDGNLYGTTTTWGKKELGAVFKITPTGAVTPLYAFCKQAGCPDGSTPVAGLILGSNGNFYGTTETGGANNSSTICYSLGCGTVFEITPGGRLTTLYSFCAQANCADGAFPLGGLVEGVNGHLYGTTYLGGANCAACGTVFELTPTGQLTTLHSFCSAANCADGSSPYSELVLAHNGHFYGTTETGGLGVGGGNPGYGTVFGITPAGVFTTVYNFCSLTKCYDGTDPYAGLIQGSDGYLYGATLASGAHNDGTVFRLSLTGKLTTIHQFCSVNRDCPDGAEPVGGLLQATDGNFYGTAQEGGATFTGIAYELTPTKSFTTLYSFCPTGFCDEGMWPQAALVQATNGDFYGTTLIGGGTICGSSCGTVFSLSTGLGPFVLPNPVFGKAGRTINILGNGLTGSTSVTFNGVAATFSVVSDTLITAGVPDGATDGTIEVTTASGTLSSNVSFHVIP